MLPSTKIFLKFSISNGEVHAVNEILSKFPDCSISNINSDCQSKSSLTDVSSNSSECSDYVTIDNSPWSRNKERVFNLNEQNSSNPNVNSNQHSNLNERILEFGYVIVMEIHLPKSVTARLK